MSTADGGDKKFLLLVSLGVPGDVLFEGSG